MPPLTPNFRKTPVAAPAPAEAAPPVATITPSQTLQMRPDGMPLPQGQKVPLTDYMRGQLEALGWKDGDPAPTAAFTQMVQEAVRDQPTAINPRTRMPDVTKLPPTTQAALAQTLADNKQDTEAAAFREQAIRSASMPLPADAHPSLVAAQRVAAEAMTGPQASIVDDRRQASFMTPPQIQSPQPGQLSAAVGTAPPPPPPPAPPETPPDTPATSAGGLPPVMHCPRCKWSLNTAFTVVPTEADRQRYMIALLGNTRFEKAYPIMNGAMTLTYRSLLATETRLAFKQVGIDTRRGEFMGDAEYLLRLMDYRLAMGLARISANSVITLENTPALEIPYTQEANGDTVLPQLLKWFNDEAIPHESLRRVVAEQMHEFQRLQESLEAQTSEPDFWIGIGQQP